MSKRTPEQAAKHAAYMVEWRKNNPEYFKKMKKYRAGYMDKPGSREKKNEQSKQHMKELWATSPEHREAKRVYKQTPDQKAKAKIRKQTPYYREQQRLYSQRIRQTPKAKYAQYKSCAKKFNRKFPYTLEQFVTLFWQKPCRYCGTTIQTVGIDRIDSSKGYAPDNAVPCCEVCNEMKLHYTKDFFIAQCKLVAAYSGSDS